MMNRRATDWKISAGLLLAVFLWGGNNVGLKVLVTEWPPLFVGSTRFLCAGGVMLAILRWTRWLGAGRPLTPDIRRKLWWGAGLSLAAYVAVFNFALRLVPASHVALYLAASPVWAMLWEHHSETNRSDTVRRLVSALLAFSGVAVLLFPVLSTSSGSLAGEMQGLTASLFWTNYGRQCRALGQSLNGSEVSAWSMWTSGILLVPLALADSWTHPPVMRITLLGVQGYCIFGGGILAFALWNHALRHWKTGDVFLFSNLIPASTMLWAWACLSEPITKNFWLAMALIILGVFSLRRTQPSPPPASVPPTE